MKPSRWTYHRVAAAYAGLLAVLNGTHGEPTFGAVYLLVALLVLALEAAPKRRRTCVRLLRTDARRRILHAAMTAPAPAACPLCREPLSGFAHFVDLYDAGAWMCRPCASVFALPANREHAA